MKKGLKRGFFGLLLTLAGLVIAVGIGLLPVNLFFAKDSIKSMLQSSIGADLEINGPLSLKLGFNPELSASSLKLRARGVDEHPLIIVDQLVINPAIIDLLRGDLHIRNLTAAKVVVNYCPRNIPESEISSGDAGLPPISIDRLTIKALQLECGQADKAMALIPQNINLEMSATRGKPLEAHISGLVSGEKLELALITSSLGELLSANKDIPLSIQLKGFESTLQADTEILNLAISPELKAIISIESQNPAWLMETAGMEPVAIPPLTIKANFLTDFESIQVNELDISLGEFSLTANGKAQQLSTRPHLLINTKISQLDANLLKADHTRSASTEEVQLLDFRPWLDQLQSFDADMAITIDEITNLPVTLKNAAVRARLLDGKLQLDHGKIKLNRSELEYSAHFDTTASCPVFVGDIEWSNIDSGIMALLLEESFVTQTQVKAAVANFNSCGFSLDDHARSFELNGTLEDAELAFKDLEQSLRFDSMTLTTGHTVPGNLSFTTAILDEQITAELKFGSVSELLNGSNWPLSLQANVASGEMSLDGTARLFEGAPLFEGHVELAIDRIGGLYRWVDIDSENPLAATGKADIILNKTSWSASAIDIQLGDSNIYGKLRYDGNELKPLLTVDLKSDLLASDELANLFSDSNESSTLTSDDSSEDQGEEQWYEGFLALPSIDYKLAITKIAGFDSDLEDIKTKGSIRQKFIDDAQLALKYEDIEISGNLDVDLRQLPWNLTYDIAAGNVDIGKLLSKLDIVHDVKAHADRIELMFSSKGESVEDLILNARLETRVESLRWSGQLRPDEGASVDALYLPLLEFSAAPSARTNWFANGDFNGAPVKFWLQSPSLKETIEGTTDLDLRLLATTGLDLAALHAVIDRSSEDHFKAEITLSGQRLETSDIQLTDFNMPLGDFELHTQLVASTDMLQLSDLKTKMGRSEISGYVRVDRVDDEIKLVTQLYSPRLEIEDFVRPMEEWRLANEVEGEAAGRSPQTHELSEGFAEIIGKLFAEFDGENSSDIKLEAAQIYSDGELLGGGQFHVVADKDQIHVSPFHMELPGGSVDAEFIASNNEDGVESALTIHIEELEYSGILRLADPESTASGFIYMDTNLEAKAPNWKQIPAAIEGNFDLIIIPDDIEAGFLDLWASNLIFALLPIGQDSTKKLNCLVARFEVEEGVMASKSILLDSTDIIIHGRGSIDLGKEELDLLFAPQAKLEKFLSISTPIEVVGPFDNFQSDLISGGFVVTMFKWYMSLIYVPYKWLTGESFPADGIATCFHAMEWEAPGTPQSIPKQ